MKFGYFHFPPLKKPLPKPPIRFKRVKLFEVTRDKEGVIEVENLLSNQLIVLDLRNRADPVGIALSRLDSELRNRINSYSVIND